LEWTEVAQACETCHVQRRALRDRREYPRFFPAVSAVFGTASTHSAIPASTERLGNSCGAIGGAAQNLLEPRGRGLMHDRREMKPEADHADHGLNPEHCSARPQVR